jgi:TonB family protein
MNKDSKKNILFLIASLALHLSIFYSLIYLNDFFFLNELYRRLDHKIVDKTKDLTTQIELVDLDKKQVVDQAKESIDETPPDETDFVSINDQTVKEQTKAQRSGEFQNSVERPAMQASQNTAPMISAEELLKSGAQKPQRPVDEMDLGLKGLSSSLNPNTVAQRRSQQMQRANLAAGTQVPAQGPSQTDDYLEDVKEGQFTLLNTRRTQYFSFYSRIKGQLRSHWNPLIREEVSFIYSTKRTPASLGVKRTSVQITLDEDGYLEEIALLKTSGNKAIDTAAIQALRLAAPFLNPPKGMLEKDKKIRIFWDFVLET